MSSSARGAYVSRGGDKLAAALREFQITPAGWTCADLGCNVGGFTDCLLQHGAARVYAVDTGYGALAWNLRRDPRVVVRERTNALHLELPEPVGLVVADMAWTRQHHLLPAALRLLAPEGLVITLVKPHYEAERSELRGGVLSAELRDAVMGRVRDRLGSLGLRFERIIESPIAGHKGNREFLGLVRQEPAEL